MLSIKEIKHNSSEYWQVVQLRREVLRLPLGLDFDEAQLESENNDKHFAAYDAQGLAGCFIISKVDNDKVKMRQVAVMPEKQGQGIGKILVKFCEDCVRNLDYKEIVLNAREAAVPFYEKLGYLIIGVPFIEVGIQHRAMLKKI